MNMVDKQGECYLKLDQEFLNQVRPAIVKCWNYIAADIDWNCSNAEAIELCLDADRISTLVDGGKAIDELIRQADKEHGYQKVEKFLCKHIQLA
jgi:hypothetical protein